MGIKDWEKRDDWVKREGIREGKREVAKAKDRRDRGRKKDHKGGRRRRRQNRTETVRPGRHKERGSGEEEKGENSFSKPARRRVPAVFIWPLTSRPLQSLQGLSLTSRRMHTRAHTHSACTSPQYGCKEWITEALLYLIKTEQRLDALTRRETQTFECLNTPEGKNSTILQQSSSFLIQSFTDDPSL